MDNTETPIPLALVRMLPHGRAAHLAAQILAQAEVIQYALDVTSNSENPAGTVAGRAAHIAHLVEDFRHVLAKETADIKASPASAPLTGTTSRSIVSAIANSILTMPDPKPGDGGWREAAHNQAWRTGTRYAQTWVTDATYWMYTADPQDQKD